MKKFLLGIFISLTAYASYIAVPPSATAVSGPGSSTNNAIPVYSGTGGQTLLDSSLIYDGSSLSKTTDGTYTLGTMTTGVGAGRVSKGFASQQWVSGNLGTHALSGSVLFSTTQGFAAVGNNNAGISSDTYGTAVNGEFAHFRARGTNTAPTANLLNDTLGVFSATGFNGTTWQIEAARRNFRIVVSADENFTASAMGTRIAVQSIEAGSIVPVTHLQWDSLGNSNFQNGNASVSELTNLNSNTASSYWIAQAGRPTFYAASNAQAPGFVAEVFNNTGSEPAADSGNIASRAVLRRSRGTNTVPLAVQTDDAIGVHVFGAYDGTAFLNAGIAKSIATENWSATNHGNGYFITTIKNGSGEVQERRLFIDGNGDTGITGNVIVSTAGKGLQVKEGSNARMGTAVLVGGTVTVANTSVTANTRVFYSVSTAGGTQGFLSQTQIAATSFTINSTSVLDTSTVNWMLVEPAP